jgi:hypothetical protein
MTYVHSRILLIETYDCTEVTTKRGKDFIEDLDYSHTSVITLLTSISIVTTNNMPKWLGKFILVYL